MNTQAINEDDDLDQANNGVGHGSYPSRSPDNPRFA